MTKQKLTKQQQELKDREESRKFMTVVAVAAVIFMLLMYFIFR